MIRKGGTKNSSAPNSAPLSILQSVLIGRTASTSADTQSSRGSLLPHDMMYQPNGYTHTIITRALERSTDAIKRWNSMIVADLYTWSFAITQKRPLNRAE